ncbi:bifunctional folylpolyglutamate synthase/dihydrofolate synthase [Rhodopseudomonas sp. AAP120]|uniref:bifunctional folylpolyglutamate synthase/dihydrofolate synthase n=1 Tax=Rhodopseudomonas sp. AAP120 TaxID=1523430 RepID=UPI0006B9F9C2|nr:cyanophycin synthetase [Rhodopseudomonas sp. AAP120]KPG01916.1 bifunctional folylpolyglutamate synthase/dihydrofolate synthase [Rhodopseudomonas sp. AAP120]
MFDLPKYGEGLCLARLGALLGKLGVDRERLRRSAIAVCGSNGKGSTAAFTASIAKAYGLRTGLFTSPHLYRFNERFRIDGEPIADDVLNSLLTRVADALAEVARERGEQFGAFEAQFALACVYFQENDCDVAVFEAGIGGRYDPVRLLGTPVSCVASVDLEHTALLGNSLALIASDKSDACAAGGTIVYGENCRPLRDHLAEYNRSRNIEALYVGDEIALTNAAIVDATQRFHLRIGERNYPGLQTSLLGAFQLNNAAIAATLLSLWLQRARPEADAARLDRAIRSGLRDARWPGRLETISNEPLTVIDVGHTPDGIRQALAGLHAAHGPRGWLLVLGVSRDKAAAEIVNALAPQFDTIVCSSAHHKGAPADVIAEAARAANPRAEVHVAPTIADAVRDARALAERLNARIYVAGGLFLAIEFAAVLRGGRAEDLRFF